MSQSIEVEHRAAKKAISRMPRSVNAWTPARRLAFSGRLELVYGPEYAVPDRDNVPTFYNLNGVKARRLEIARERRRLRGFHTPSGTC
jgi:hypothetical protein